jgi:WD40 repeat protein
MPEQPPPRRRFRLLRWSLFGLALVGLGFLLNVWLLPRPRCVIPIPARVRIEFLSDDGSTILTSRLTIQDSVTGPLQAWDTKTGENLGSFLDNFQASSLSPDGRFLAALGHGDLHLIKLKPAREAKKIIEFLWDLDSVELAFSSGGHFLAAASIANGTGHFVECSTGRVAKSLQELAFFRFLPDERALIVEEGKFFVWDPRTGKAIRTFKAMDPIDLSPNGRTLLAQSADKGVFLLDMRTEETTPLDPRISEGPIRSAFSPDGKTLVTFSKIIEPLEIAVWDVASGNLRHAEKIADLDLRAVVFSPDSALFLQGDYLRDSSTGRVLWKRNLFAQMGGIEVSPALFDVRFSPDSQFLVRSNGFSFEKIDAPTGEIRTNISPIGFSTDVFRSERCIQSTKDGSFYSVWLPANQGPSFLEELLGDWWPWKTNLDDRKITVFETATGRIVSELQGRYGAGYLSNDGRTMVTPYLDADGSYSMRIYDLPLRPPLLLVVGIPLGLGLLVLFFSRWRARRRGRSAVASVATATTNAEQKP